MKLSFKQFLLLKEDPDHTNFRVGGNNYYTRYDQNEYNPITFNVYGKNFMAFSPTKFNYHDAITDKLTRILFDPLNYYRNYVSAEYDNIEDMENDFFLNETFDRIKNDLGEQHIYLIGDFNRETVEIIRNIHYYGGEFIRRPQNNPDFILGRMFSVTVKEFQGENNKERIPCFSLWNRLKDLTPEATETILKLPPLYYLDSNKSIIENPGLESKMLRSFLK